MCKVLFIVVLNIYSIFCYAQNVDSLLVGDTWKKINQGDSVYRDTLFVPINLDGGRKDSLIVESFTPSYPGGFTMFRQDFANSFRYPLKRVTGQSVVVMIKFVVNRDGTIRDVENLQILDPLIVEEIKRVMMSMKRWHGGKVGMLKANLRIGVNVVIHF